MPRLAGTSQRAAQAAVALGLGLALVPGGAALAKDPGMPETAHGGWWTGDMGPGIDVPSLDDQPTRSVVTSGSGAVALVRVCDHDVHVAVIAAGQGGDRLIGGDCDHADHTAALAMAGGGAVGMATDGAALTAPAATAPSLGQVLAIDAAAAQAAPVGHAHGGMMGMSMEEHMAHHGMGMGMAMPMGGHAGPGGMHVGRGGLYSMSRGEGRARGMKAIGGEERGGKGGKKARGGQVTAMPSTGAGMPLAPNPAVQSVLAAIGAAAAGLAGLRRRAIGG